VDDEDEPGTNQMTVDLGMVCTCTPGDLAAAEKRTQRVRDTLPKSGGPLVTAICGSLLMNHGVRTVQIYADQWFVIEAIARDGTRYVVGCDEVEHGIARIWEEIHDQTTRESEPPTG
jgi:hypothetical protein